jgi:hypothetical protein
MYFNIAKYMRDYEAEEEQRSVVSDGHVLLLNAIAIFLFVCEWICSEVNDGEVVFGYFGEYLTG